jgi:hypothetical protein
MFRIRKAHIEGEMGLKDHIRPSPNQQTLQKKKEKRKKKKSIYGWFFSRRFLKPSRKQNL